MEHGQWIAGHMLVPYPPGIPILMPGEVLEEDNPQVQFLKALEEFNRKFPGFEREIHGIMTDDKGNFWMRCVKVPTVDQAKEGTFIASVPSFVPKMRQRFVTRSMKKGRS
jgi:arginine decarboxylase